MIWRLKRFRGNGGAGTFLVIGSLSLVIGGHDVLFGTITEARLTGAAIAAAGFLMLAAVCGLLVERWRQAWGPQIALLAGFVGIGLGLYLLLTQLPYLDGARLLLPAAWAACVIACLMAIVRRPKPAAVTADPQAARPVSRADRFWVKTIARLSSLGISAGLIFNLLQLWYAQVEAAPNNNAYGLSITDQLRDDGQSADRLFHEFSAQVTLKNPTGSEVQILRSRYAFFGASLSLQPSSDEDFARRLQASRKVFESRFLTYGPRELLEVGEFLYTPSQLEPAQEFDAQFELAFPQSELSKYRYVRFATNFVVAKGSRLHVDPGWQSSLGTCSDGTFKADQCTVTAWPIVSPGWLWTLTRGTQIVETVEGLSFKAMGDIQAAWLASCIIRDVDQLSAPARSVCDGARREPALEKFFGLGYLGPVVYDQAIVAPG